MIVGRGRHPAGEVEAVGVEQVGAQAAQYRLGVQRPDRVAHPRYVGGRCQIDDLHIGPGALRGASGDIDDADLVISFNEGLHPAAGVHAVGAAYEAQVQLAHPKYPRA